MDIKDLANSYAKNKFQINKALKQQKLVVNQAIKTNNRLQEFVNIRVYLILLAAWIESALNHFLYHYDTKITANERKQILNQRSQEMRWKKLIELSFRRQYSIDKNKKIIQTGINTTISDKYKFLIEIVDNEIIALIGIRNKLAHGQWAIAMNFKGESNVSTMTTKLWNLTKKDTVLFKNIAVHFLNLIEPLVASKSKFEANFNKLKYIIQGVRNTEENYYTWIIDLMKKKYDNYSRLPLKKI